MARTSYGRLFKSTPHPDSAASEEKGGPAAVAEPKQETGGAEQSEGSENLMVRDEHWKERLHFVFAPDLSALVNPKMDDLVGVPLHSHRSRLVVSLTSSRRTGRRHGQACHSQWSRLGHSDSRRLHEGQPAAGHPGRRSPQDLEVQLRVLIGDRMRSRARLRFAVPPH